jgi:hypothetical protein
MNDKRTTRRQRALKHSSAVRLHALARDQRHSLAATVIGTDGPLRCAGPATLPLDAGRRVGEHLRALVSLLRKFGRYVLGFSALLLGPAACHATPENFRAGATVRR